jgi:uncharacterized protein YdhG (YjbR/CyaY superfamily)
MPAKPKTVEQYLSTLPIDRRVKLEKLREVLRKAAPEAEEVISYSMPAFKDGKIVAWYAAAKNHYALYVYPRVRNVFAEELSEYAGTKSSIHFEYDKSLPVKLVSRIAKESLRQIMSER